MAPGAWRLVHDTWCIIAGRRKIRSLLRFVSLPSAGLPSGSLPSAMPVPS